ncbi:MAG: gliding motility-associated C-terminal domain-containing protein [Bacteroidia bacterium]
MAVGDRDGGGGTFLAVTPGTVVDPDGRLRLAASGPGMHVVRYRTPGACADSLDVAVDIYAAASAAFSYAGSSFCTGDTVPLPLITGTPGGTFSADSGCVVNPSTGAIDLDQTGAGTYNITYAHTGSCQSSFTQTVVIGATDTASMISYHPFRFCPSGLDPVPLVSGDTVGRFIAGGGIVFANTDIGQLDLSVMQPGGPYLVTYDIENRCARDVQDSVWIELPDDPSFSYPQSAYCEGAVNPLPDSIVMPGGTFGELTMNVTFLDNTTGLIDASRSNSGGPYFIRYTTAGPCPETGTFQITILPRPVGALLDVQPDTMLCEGEVATLTVDAGGVTSVQWMEGGVHRPAYDDVEAIVVLDHAVGRDTVAAVLGNAAGCYDTLVAPLEWLARPVLSVRTVSLVAGANGTVEAVYELDTQDQVDSMQVQVQLVGGDPVLATLLRPTGWPSEYRATLHPRRPQDLQVVRAWFLGMGPACSAVASVSLDTVIAGESPIFVPEVFTPNGDGKNDTWMVTCTADADPADYRIYLFNPSGGKVYEMIGLHQQFDGGRLPDGVYWWVLQDSQGRDLQNGGVTIRRK